MRGLRREGILWRPAPAACHRHQQAAKPKRCTHPFGFAAPGRLAHIRLALSVASGHHAYAPTRCPPPPSPAPFPLTPAVCRLADVLGQTKLSPLADLVSSNFRFASLLGTYQPLADAISSDPRMATLLAEGEAQAGALCCHGQAPSLAHTEPCVISRVTVHSWLQGCALLRGCVMLFSHSPIPCQDVDGPVADGKGGCALCLLAPPFPTHKHIQTDEGMLASAVCKTPGLAQELANNVEALLSNRQLATMVANNADMQVGEYPECSKRRVLGDAPHAWKKSWQGTSWQQCWLTSLVRLDK